MTKKTIIFIAAIVYLLIGAVFYTNDVRYSRSAINICPQEVVGEDQKGGCLPQNISLKTDWPIAVITTVGWLPIIILQAIDG